ncbi:Methylthioribose-1-phosphate isomerase [bacterium HR12]|nr:Methylthioribose-1-phosphate isomerase [bacterium HR12]
MTGPGIVPVEWRGDAVAILGQRLLPHREEVLECRTVAEVAEAIRSLAVRGAPIIGVTAAYGMALAATLSTQTRPRRLLAELEEAARTLKAARPTAVNLAWAVDRMMRVATGQCCSVGSTVQRVHEAMVAEALRIEAEDREACAAIGAHGLELVPEGARVLTHCNTGMLCTAGIGTALGVIVAAHRAGRGVHVWVDETRPVLQGARLTAWELGRLGIPRTLVVDAAAGSLMARGLVDLVIVGADRIAANGDVANKIGTYPLAVLARHHGVPFYVAAPTSTVDLGTGSGAGIPIEERDPAEVLAPGGVPVAEPDTPVANPAFDVTPAELVSAIVTERGVVRPPYARTLAELVAPRGAA